ncbi:PAX-interacting protein 1-like [Ptychodera flava]|uniref:PAX-interacting protein 1-like n=1 Tax=Ptychodera flava TaxID=63121 RepID=UPI00396A7C80
MKMVEEKDDESLLQVPSVLFKDIKYYLIGQVEEKIVDLLNRGGANQETYLTTNVTHVITDEGNHDEVSEAKDIFDLPVVMSYWVTMSIKCGCILPYSAFSPGTSQIFTGVVACPSQITGQDKDKLWSIITYYGGKCQLNFDKKCTHLIVPRPEGAKYECAVQHKDSFNVKIVMPDWIIDSVTMKIKQNEAKYHPRLIIPPKPPTPRPVIETVSEPVLELEKHPAKVDLANIVKESDTFPQLPVNQPFVYGQMDSKVTSTSKQPFPASAANNNRFQALLQQNIQGDKTSREHPKPKQRRSRTKTQDRHPQNIISVPDTHEMGPGPYGRFQTNALEMPEMRTLRNITNNAQMSPMMMMRPPVPDGRDMSQVLAALGRASARQCMRQKTPGFNDTNNVQNQLQHHPPTPPSLLQSVHYFGHDSSQNIPRDCCLLGCVFLIIEYQTLVDQEMIETWKKVITKFGGLVDDCYSERITHVICDSQKTDVFKLAMKDGKRVVTAHWLNDCLTVKKMAPPWRALHLPTPYPIHAQPCKDQVIAVTGFEGKDRSDVKVLVELVGAKYTGFLTRGNTVLICHRQEGAKFEKAREWRLPIVNVQWLNDIALGYMDALRNWGAQRYQTYDTEDPLRLVHQFNNRLMGPWTTPLKLSQAALRNFKPSVHLRSLSVADDDGYNMNGNKRKLANESSNSSNKMWLCNDNEDSSGSPRVLFTGIDPAAVLILSEKVKSLGGEVVQSSYNCSHLVASKITRTTKFLASLSVCKFVVSPKWIEKSINKGVFVDESEDSLVDTETEEHFSFKLSEALQRASKIRVFQGMTLYVTPSVKPDASQMIDIVECGGGRLITRKPALNSVANMKDTNGRPLFVVISCDNDLPLCRDFILNNTDVHSAEFILTGALTQRLDYLSYRFEP